jgi:acetylornithine deacetylase
MEVAVSEKGLMVLDCIAAGKAGHAAREEGENAIYNALQDIDWFRTFRFPKTSPTLGDIKMSVTVIQAGQAHNQVPAECKFTVDVRVTDSYTLEEVLAIIRQHVHPGFRTVTRWWWQRGNWERTAMAHQLRPTEH